MADEQPPAEGEEPIAEETSSDAPEASSSDAPEATAPDAPEASSSDAPEAATPDASDAPADQPGDEGEPAAPVEATAAPDEPVAEEPAAPAEATAAPDEPVAEEPAAPAEATGEAAAPAEATDAPAEPATGEGTPTARRQRPEQTDRPAEQPAEPDVVPGAHLEPDLVLEESRPAEGEFDPYASDDDSPVAEGEQAATVEETVPVRTPLDLAADARYRATGKRKRAIARVILKPGDGTYTINGKELDTYFPRITLQKNCRLPLETTGNDSRMDVVAKIHGGGVSSQAIALRHGISRALVEADPNLRTELKRQGFLTRDARVKERKKAGLKKARKRPQFSKR
jgi:small subunit ribosomal protein S9